MKTGKIFWGLLVVGCGVMLLLAALGFDVKNDIYRIVGSILLVGIAVTSLVKMHFFLTTIAVALGIYLWQIPLGITDMNLWLTLLAAAVLGIGVSIIFHKKGTHVKTCFKESHKDRINEETLTNDEIVNIDASFDEQTKYVHANNLKKVNISSNFASIKVYFDQCQISGDGLTINISGNFSGIVLTLPRSWIVENHISTFAAAVNQDDDNRIVEGSKVLLKGSLNFADVKIIRV